MNKFIHLVIVKFLGMYNLNEILIAKKEGIKTIFERKMILYGLLLIVFGSLYYSIINKLNFEDLKYILYLGMMISLVIIFLVTLTDATAMLFGDDGDEVIFTLPIRTKQILLCKVLQMYIKNLSYVLVIGLCSLLSFYQRGGVVNNLFFLYFIILNLTIPIGPILIVTLFSYGNQLLNFKFKSKVKLRIIKIVMTIIIVGIVGLVINHLKEYRGMEIVEELIRCCSYIYIPLWLSIKCLNNCSFIYFILNIGLLIILGRLYYYLISEEYVMIYSLLRGVNKRKKFFYERRRNWGIMGGLIRKEFNYLRGHKLYFIDSYGISISISMLLGLILLIFFKGSYMSDEVLDEFSLYAPILLSALVSFKVSTSSSVSLEKSNWEMLFSLPVKIDKVLVAKWITNIIIGGIIVIVDATMLIMVFKPKVVIGVLLYVIPLAILAIISFTGLLGDLRFVEKRLVSDAEILGNRIITYVPSGLSIIFALMVSLFGTLGKVQYTLLAFMGLFVIVFLGEVGYFIIFKKKLIRNLVS